MKQLLGEDTAELREDLRALGQPAYRAAQVQRWLYEGVPFEEMTNLPKSLREKLRETYSEGYAKIREKKTSADGTTKYLLEFEGGSMAETVYLPYDYGSTICISTQIGCAMGCSFCASCKNGLERSLTAGEMLAQIIAANADQKKRVSRVVLMGMGEPLQNTDNVLWFLKLANSPDGLGIGQRNMTLSTCGITDQIDRLADENLQITLAVSLHAPDQLKREKLMPSAKKYRIDEIIDAAKRYFEKTGRRVTFEYALIHGVNDTEHDAAALARRLAPLNTHVNLIPLNSTGDMHGCSRQQAYAFADRLARHGVPATVRRSMGRDIEGACGQLRQRALQEEKEPGCPQTSGENHESPAGDVFSHS